MIIGIVINKKKISDKTQNGWRKCGEDIDCIGPVHYSTYECALHNTVYYEDKVLTSHKVVMMKLNVNK